VIPLKFHFIWIGRDFPFVNRLAVESVLQTHPGASVVVHFQNPPENNPDWEALKPKAEFRPIDLEAWLRELPGTLRPVGEVLEKIAVAYPAGRSNVLRYLILYREGGIYLDFDTLTLKPFLPLLGNPAFIGEEEVFRADDDRVAGRYAWDFPLMAALFGLSYGLAYANCWLGNLGALNRINRGLMRLWSAQKLNNAVLGSEPHNAFFSKALELIPSTPAGMRFALGPMLMNRVYETGAASSIHRLEKDIFYAIPPSQTFRFFYGPAPVLPEKAIAIHWCSSNHRQLAPKLTRQLLEAPNSNSLYARLAQGVFARGI
jgi:hypothetical protein